MTFRLGDVIIPVKLVYHAGGHKVADNASWVGLGWRLSCEYSITREVRGVRDDAGNGLLGNSMPQDYTSSCLTQNSKSQLTALIDYGEDGERDVFNYNTPLRSNSFLLTSPVTFQESDKSKITYYRPEVDITSMELTDENGNVFLFQDYEFNTTPFDGITAWHLKEFQSSIPNQKAVFNYFDNGMHSYDYGYYDYETYNYLLENMPSVPPGKADDGGANRTTLGNSRLLNEIYFPNGKITFVPSTGNRADGFGKSLAAIEVRAYNHTTQSYELTSEVYTLAKYKKPGRKLGSGDVSGFGSIGLHCKWSEVGIL